MGATVPCVFFCPLPCACLVCRFVRHGVPGCPVADQGIPYYLNLVSRKQQWERPAAFKGNTAVHRLMKKTNPALQAGGSVTTPRLASMAPKSTWVQKTDPTTGRAYFFNFATGARQWDKPRQFDESSLVRSGWTKRWSAEEKRPYFVHLETRRQQWDRPDDMSDSGSDDDDDDDGGGGGGGGGDLRTQDSFTLGSRSGPCTPAATPTFINPMMKLPTAARTGAGTGVDKSAAGAGAGTGAGAGAGAGAAATAAAKAAETKGGTGLRTLAAGKRLLGSIGSTASSPDLLKSRAGLPGASAVRRPSAEQRTTGFAQGRFGARRTPARGVPAPQPPVARAAPARPPPLATPQPVSAGSAFRLSPRATVGKASAFTRAGSGLAAGAAAGPSAPVGAPRAPMTAAEPQPDSARRPSARGSDDPHTPSAAQVAAAVQDLARKRNSDSQPQGAGWERHVDDDTGAAFWFNTLTEESKWISESSDDDDSNTASGGASGSDSDSDSDSSAPNANVVGMDQPPPGAGWVRHVDDDSGAYFWFNSVSGDSVWIAVDDSSDSDG